MRRSDRLVNALVLFILAGDAGSWTRTRDSRLGEWVAEKEHRLHLSGEPRTDELNRFLKRCEWV